MFFKNICRVLVFYQGCKLTACYFAEKWILTLVSFKDSCTYVICRFYWDRNPLSHYWIRTLKTCSTELCVLWNTILMRSLSVIVVVVTEEILWGVHFLQKLCPTFFQVAKTHPLLRHSLNVLISMNSDNFTSRICLC